MDTEREVRGGDPVVADLQARQKRLGLLLAEARALFPEVQPLPKDDRVASAGKIGGEEAKGMHGVLAAMEARPAVFASLADMDEGNDPTVLETDLIRRRLECHDVYRDIADDMGALARLFDDQALGEGVLVAPVLRAAYEIAKPVSKRDPVIRGKIAPMLDYHGANAAARKAKAKPAK